MAVIDDRIFVSMFAFPYQYVIIDHLRRNHYAVNYYDNSYRGIIVREIDYKNGDFSSNKLSDKFKKYALDIEGLHEQRSLLISGATTKQEAKITLERLGISKKQVREFLARIP